MKIFFDCEFTGLRKDTDLISIGLIDESGLNSFYGVFSDYNTEYVDDWIKENVIENLAYSSVGQKFIKTYYGDKESMSKELNLWLLDVVQQNNLREDQYDTDDNKIQFVSDVGHYEFVLLLDLITNGKNVINNLPDYISPALMDLNQIIYAEKIPNGLISLFSAFDLKREELLSSKFIIRFLKLEEEIPTISLEIFKILLETNEDNNTTQKISKLLISNLIEEKCIRISDIFDNYLIPLNKERIILLNNEFKHNSYYDARVIRIIYKLIEIKKMF